MAARLVVVSCQLRVSSARKAVKIEPEREAEGSPPLEDVAGERLIKTQQAGERLSGC
jgi:hypothetical protein